MVFVVCGLNHKTASLALREKIARPVELQHDFLNHCLNDGVVSEIVMLSTCNRTELYCISEFPETIPEWIAGYYQIPLPQLQPSLYLHLGEDGLRHSLKVASGLDSMMLGEPQILGQMKASYQLANSLGTTGRELNALFQSIFSASKRIRTSSGIGNNPTSIAYLSAQVIKRHSVDSNFSVFLIGAGETTSLVAKYLSKQAIPQFMVASRTLESAKLLADKVHGLAVNISDIPEYLARADVVVTATSCPLPFINKNMVQMTLERRKNKPQLFLDLAVPRDIEEDVGSMEHITLYNIDDLQLQIQEGMNEKRAAAIKAEQLIDDELEKFLQKHRMAQAKDHLCNYQQQMNDFARQELQRALRKLNQGYEHQEVLQEFSERLVNKLSHSPLVGMKQAASEGRTELLDLAEYLFNPSSLRHNYEKVS